MSRAIIRLAMGVVIVIASPIGLARAQAVDEERTFSEGEIRLLKQVFARDKMLKELSTQQPLFKAFNKVLSYTAPGPLKLAFKWNQAAFEGWGKANNQLKKIGDARTCDDLLYPSIENSPNADFFENLRKVRGCE